MRGNFYWALVAFAAVSVSLPAVGKVGKVTTANPLISTNLGPVWEAKCKNALLTPLPSEAGVPAAPAMNERINTFSLYNGVGEQSRDVTAARRLAWSERAAYPLKPGGAPGLSGPLILAMIYANGEGVPRNAALALRMACEATAYPNNLEAVDLDVFDKTINSQTQPAPHLDLCAPGPKGTMVTMYCRSLSGAQHQQAWSEQLKLISRSWTPEQKEKLDKWKKSFLIFFGGHSIYESDVALGIGQSQPPGLPGPNSAREDQEQYASDDSTLNQIEEMEAGHLPATSALPLTEADADLNRDYQDVMDHLRAPMDSYAYVIEPLNEREIELEWIRFRDAWLELVHSRYPHLDAGRWRAQLTVDRTQTLREMARNLSPVDPGAKDWLAACAKYRSAPLPQEIRSLRSPTGRLSCDSYADYYGTPPHYASARRCAAYERAGIPTNPPQPKRSAPIKDDSADQPDVIGWRGCTSEEIDLEGSLNGSGILAMIYANGKGVPPDEALAIRFACEAIDLGKIGPSECSQDRRLPKDVFGTLIERIEAGADNSLDQKHHDLDIREYTPF